MKVTKEQREYRAWVASRPPVIQALITSHPPDQCYRAENGGHYIIRAYQESDDGTAKMRVEHGRDSFMPGFGVFGMEPDDLAPCPTQGDWEPAGEDELEASQEKADLMIAMRRAIQ